MARPISVVKDEAKKRLAGKFGVARIRELQKILSELSGYKSGPYAELRKTLISEISGSRERQKAKHFDESFVLRRKGFKQIALIGFPNAGKSSLLNLLTDAKSKVGQYAFTTLQVASGIMNVNGARIEIVDIPGLIEGASENKGLGKRVLSIARFADALVLILDSSANPSEQLRALLNELEQAKIIKPTLIVINKCDLGRTVPSSTYKTIHTSAITEEGIQNLKNALLELLDLITVKVTHSRTNESYIMSIEKDSAIEDLIKKINERFVERFQYAKVSGSSTKFTGQQVGLRHIINDGDEIELHLKA